MASVSSLSYCDWSMTEGKWPKVCKALVTMENLGHIPCFLDDLQ